MKFFKENSYDIVRLYINQIGFAIFSMVVYTATGLLKFDNDTTPIIVKALVSVFCMLFYYSLIYNVCWECGAKDKIRIEGGKYEVTKFKGGLMGFFANVPNFILSGVSLILIVIHMLSGAMGVLSAFGYINLVMRLHEAPYLGIIQALTPQQTVGTGDVVLNINDFLLESILYFVIPLVSVAVCYLAYLMGRRDKRIFGSAFVKKKYE